LTTAYTSSISPAVTSVAPMTSALPRGPAGVARGTDAPEVIERRVRDALAQLRRCGEYDYLVMNDVLETACAQLEGIVVAELSRRSRRESWVRALTTR
jgi:hypothetical protein